MSTDEAPVFAFTDKLGRRWTIPAEFDAFEAVRNAAGVDLLDLATTQACLEKLRDPYTTAAALQAFTAGQARDRGLSPEQFRAGLDGETLRTGCDAMIDCAVFFSPSRIQPVLKTIVTTAREAEEQLHAKTIANLATIQANARRALEGLTTSAASSTSSPASSASTPDDGACGPSRGRRAASSRKTGNAPRP